MNHTNFNGYIGTCITLSSTGLRIRTYTQTPGSMTAGADGTTIDGMSNERIAKIIASLRDRSYQPKPARREYIAKKNSNKMRPLGIQSGDDKLVQEVVKMILESIYEPVLSKHSHGFRPNRSCQTALQQIQKTFTGANWFVEGDIHACFDSFNHHTVIALLRKRIEDEFVPTAYLEISESRLYGINGHTTEPTAVCRRGRVSVRCLRTYTFMNWINSWKNMPMISVADRKSR